MKVEIIQAGFTKEWFKEAHIMEEHGCYIPKPGVRYYDPNKVEFWNQGYLEMEDFDAENCFHLLNWSCWTDDKPSELTGTKMTHCNSDIILHPEGGKYYVACFIGWRCFNTLEKAKSFLKRESMFLWTLRDYKL